MRHRTFLFSKERHKYDIATVAAMIMIGNAPAARWTHAWIFGTIPGILRRIIEDPL
jgi:hypothetical protein